MNTKSDEQLMECFAADTDGQKSQAFDHLYSRYAKRMVNYFYYSLGNNNEKAQDFLHDLFIKVIENKDSFDKTNSFQAWIYRMASNMCKNEYRSTEVQNKYKSHVLATASATADKEDYIEELKLHISSLKPQQRELIILRYKLSLSVKEMAAICECPEGTIRSRLFYIIKELSKKIT